MNQKILEEKIVTESRDIDMRSVSGIVLAERMKARGWKVGTVGWTSIEMVRKLAVGYYYLDENGQRRYKKYQRPRKV